MVCVRGIGPASEHCVDLCAARQRVLLGLDDERAAALADDKAVPVQVKRPAGVFRVVVAAGQRLGLRQAGDHDRAQNALAADCQDGFRLARAQQHGRGHHRVAACRAGGVERQARAVDAVGDRDLRRGNIADGHGHKARADAVACVKRGLGVCNRGHAVHRRSHHDADTVGLGLDCKAAVRQRFLRCGKRELHERVHRARKRFGHEVGRLKVLELGRNLHRQGGCVKPRDPADAALAADQRLPIVVHADADRRNRPHTCYDQSFLFHASSPFAPYFSTRPAGRHKQFSNNFFPL